LSRVSSDGFFANSVAYVGRASFRIEEAREDDRRGRPARPADSLVTARIGLRAPVHFDTPAPIGEIEQEADRDIDYRITKGALARWLPARLQLPAWTLGALGLLAFAAGLLIAASVPAPPAAAAPLATAAEMSTVIQPVIEQLPPRAAE
jgi:hypothetical protein